jgi:N-(2-amino-2-carboxyethyl)-L-glutamate synthase
MIYDSAYKICPEDIYLDLHALLPDRELFLKIEGLNPAGSIKLKTAIALIEEAEKRGALSLGGRVIESSSGNLGIALSMVCATKGYSFICVTDPNASPQSVAIMRAFGAHIVNVDQRDENGGYLASRITLIKKWLEIEPDLVWVNQYANPANVRVHQERTAAAILEEIGSVDYLFVGAGTTGTLMGCAAYFRQFSPHTRVIAVDAQGSVTFGHSPGPRYIPGIGTSRRPEICRCEEVDEVVLVTEQDAIRMCRWLATKQGLMVGGSTGSVLSAVLHKGPDIPPGSRVVAISPDLGDRYLSTVYSDTWVTARFDPAVVQPEQWQPPAVAGQGVS